MKNLCDFHSHTTASDGSFSPEQLIRYAKEKECGVIAVTDHDTIEGLEEAAVCAEKIGQEMIPGIEITTKLDACEIHIIGLFVDYHDEKFVAAVNQMARTRDERNFRMIEKLEVNGFDIHLSDLDKYKDGIITKAHIGALLIERGYGTELKEVVNKYLAKGCIAYVERETPEPEYCIQLIHRAGGLAFVAHTNQIDRSSRCHSEEICRKILQMGADGLETRYCEFDEDWNIRTEKLAEEFGCLRSGGSDFHGTYKRNLDLVTGYGDLEVPYEFYTKMKEKLKDK